MGALRTLKRLFCWKTVAAVVAICLLSLAPGAAYVPVPTPTDDVSIVHHLGDDPVVFVTLHGAVYHRADCRHLTVSAVPLRLSQAARHYRPCKACRPPVLR